LHIEMTGQGAPLLLIHGWGMHSGMWGTVAAELEKTHRVFRVDLPGHGQSNQVKLASKNRAGDASFLDDIVVQLSKQFSEPLTIVGWSLGGQVALRWAQLHSSQVARLILIATTPCFAQKENWICAMAAETLQEFADALTQNYTQTLRRFLSLQLRGSDNEKEVLVGLRAQLFSRGQPDVAGLTRGLEILRETDMRESLRHIMQPTLVLAGERDMLTPKAASDYMVQALPNARLAIMEGAAHAPFLSHPKIVMQHLASFLNE